MNGNDIFNFMVNMNKAQAEIHRKPLRNSKEIEAAFEEVDPDNAEALCELMIVTLEALKRQEKETERLEERIWDQEQ